MLRPDGRFWATTMGDAAQPADRTSPASALAAFEAHMGAAEGRPEGRGFDFVVALRPERVKH